MTVVVGGGRIAERKVQQLLQAGASVKVISPELTAMLGRLSSKKTIRHVSRCYRTGDLADAFLVIAATDSAVTNRNVAEDAPALVNVVDTPSQCNFIVPSVVLRGALCIAVSTSGVSPALSKTIRKELEKYYGPYFSDYLLFVRKIRTEALSGIEDPKKRERFLKSLAAKDILDALRLGRLAEVKARVRSDLQTLLRKR